MTKPGFELLSEKSDTLIETKKETTPTKNINTNVNVILEQLITVGAVSETTHLFGADWTIKLLNQGETFSLQLEASKDGASESWVPRVTATRLELVTQSVQSVNSIPINILFKQAIIDNPDIDAEIAVRNAFREYIRKLAPGIVEALAEKYSEIEKKRNDEIELLKKK